MMSLRRAGLSGLADVRPPAGRPLTGIRIHVADLLAPGEQPDAALPRLAGEIAGRLLRTGARPGPGAAVLAGLSRHFDVARSREFHERLFGAVWAAFRDRASGPRSGAAFRVKSGTITDGAIPLELYGSRWSFKDLHIDREVLLFSHLYGPVSGFTGGDLLLVDIWPYLNQRALRFDDAFEWSGEPTEGSKPVLRAEHCEAALAECGVTVGAPGPDEIVFVNNLPDAGVLHGATAVSVTDPGSFRREYHRCTVKDVTL